MGTLSSSETFESKFLESFEKKYELINEVTKIINIFNYF